MTLQKIIKENEKEFEEKFPSHISMNHGLKSFLLSSQTNLIKGLIEEVEGMKPKDETHKEIEEGELEYESSCNECGSLEALQKVINYLKI